MSILGTQRVGHVAIIPTSGYTEKEYTLKIRITGSKNIEEARRFFETDLLNRHISAGDCQLITASLTEA